MAGPFKEASTYARIRTTKHLVRAAAALLQRCEEGILSGHPIIAETLVPECLLVLRAATVELGSSSDAEEREEAAEP